MVRYQATPSLSQHLWQLKLARGYVNLYGSLPDGPAVPWSGCGHPLLSREYVGALETRVWNFLSQEEERCREPLKSYFRLHPQEVSEFGSEETCLLAKLLVWHDIPCFKLSSEGELFVVVVVWCYSQCSGTRVFHFVIEDDIFIHKRGNTKEAKKKTLKKSVNNLI